MRNLYMNTTKYYCAIKYKKKKKRERKVGVENLQLVDQ